MLCSCAMMFKAAQILLLDNSKNISIQAVLILPFHNDAECRGRRREMSHNDQGPTFSQLFIHLQTHAGPSPWLWTEKGSGQVHRSKSLSGSIPLPQGHPFPVRVNIDVHINLKEKLTKERQIIKGDPTNGDQDPTHTYLNNQHKQYLQNLKTFS